MNNQTNIIMLGTPGSGKGTHAKLIADKYGLEHISTGDLFRYEIAHKTPLGIRAETIINRGNLCPDDITLNMLHNHIQQHKDSRGFIFDGVPRTVEQAKFLDHDDIFKGLKINLVIYLDVDTDVAEKRILRRAGIENRTDDTPETIKARIANFFTLTLPLKKYYEDMGKLVIINGTQDIDTVFKNICDIIDTRLKRLE